MDSNLSGWIKADDGSLVNLAQIAHIYRSVVGNKAQILCDTFADTVLCLADCTSPEQAAEALNRLERMLPIAVVDMDLDILGPLESAQAREQQPLCKCGAPATNPPVVSEFPGMGLCDDCQAEADQRLARAVLEQQP